jgi:enamine deaminase RidA (YjgF/YER057c/UK114 family)
MITTIDPDTVPPPPGGWYSHAARVETGAGALLFVSGQVALDDDGDIVGAGDMERQADRVFTLLGRILADQGAGFGDVVGIRTFVTDMGLLAAYGAVRARYLTGPPPTSTTVEVSRLFRPEALVEVDLVAAIGG